MSTEQALQPNVRYSDEELEEFKALIKEKLGQARENLQTLRSSLSGSKNGVDDTSPTFKMLEDGGSMEQRDENSKLAARQEKYIQSLEFALMRIENKTYGICRVTGKLIPKERLRCVPTTTVCLEVKMKEKKR